MNITVRQCMIGETEWFRKLEGEYHYMGESHAAGTCYRAAGWEEVGKTKGFSRVNHARDFYIPNGRPKMLFMKPFRRDAWDLIVSNALPDGSPRHVRRGLEPLIGRDCGLGPRFRAIRLAGWRSFSVKCSIGIGQKQSAK